MSNYYDIAKRPGGTEWEEVEMCDDFYGTHWYGVRFPDGRVYKKEDCTIKPRGEE